MRPFAVSLGLALSLLGADRLHAQEAMVPIGTQFSLFQKILTFDRNFGARVGEEVVVGVVYQSRHRTSMLASEDAIKAARQLGAGGKAARVVQLDLDEGDLEALLAGRDVDLLYVAPLRAVSMDEITRVVRRRSIRTFTGMPDYVEAGLAVGVGLHGNRPEIVINMAAARAEGSEFTSQLLKLATLVHLDPEGRP